MKKHHHQLQLAADLNFEAAPMGRSPCCDKIGLKKGPWTPEEDQKLIAYVQEHGHGSWRALPPKAGLERCGKSCRLRWTNYLRPDIKRGKFSLQEEQTIIQLHALLGNRWSAIATHLPKRTDNEIKNYWNTHLKKRLVKMGIDPVSHKPKNDDDGGGGGGGGGGALYLPAKTASNLSHMAQWESARLEAEARLVRQSTLRSNSFQFGTGSGSGSGSSQFQKSACPGRCGVAWRASGMSGGEAVESSTSTLSSSAGVEVGRSSCDGDEIDRGWKHLPEFRDGIQLQPLSNSSSEHVPASNFVEKFTDLLLSASSGDRQFPDDGEADNKNYWNSILNLVNSSPSDSPMF